MAEQNQEYDQYAPQTSGRLFSNAMFGFNKEEVLEYLEELADEHFQQQDAAERQIQELNKKIQSLETDANTNNVSADVFEELNTMRRQLEEARRELEIARAAAQQAEEELHQYKLQLGSVQQENTWLREEYQKNDQQITELRRQLDSASQGQWSVTQDAALQQVAELQKRLDEAQANIETLRAANHELSSANEELAVANEELSNANDELTAANEELTAAEAEWEDIAEENTAAGQTATAIIEEARAHAERIREEAYSERDRLHRQVRSSAGGLAESITNLRTDISGVEGEVGEILESMQVALADILSSLGRTEQNLTTLGVQVDRFPSPSPPVPRPQQVVYFQPSQQPIQQQAAVSRPAAQRAEQRAPYAAPSAPYAAKPAQNSGFRRVWPEEETTRNFSPSYSNTSAAAPAPGYWPQNAEVYQQAPQEDISQEERLRNLSDSLVETLRQLMN